MIRDLRFAPEPAQLQIQAVADGFDPYAGIMHHTRPDFPAYVYDLIEPERPNVDASILRFAQSRKFSGVDFVLRGDGVCRLGAVDRPDAQSLIQIK